MDLTSVGYVSNFTTMDWCIVGAYLLLSVGMLVACAAAVHHLGWTNIRTTERDGRGETPIHLVHGSWRG